MLFICLDLSSGFDICLTFFLTMQKYIDFYTYILQCMKNMRTFHELHDMFAFLIKCTHFSSIFNAL